VTRATLGPPLTGTAAAHPGPNTASLTHLDFVGDDRVPTFFGGVACGQARQVGRVQGVGGREHAQAGRLAAAALTSTHHWLEPHKVEAVLGERARLVERVHTHFAGDHDALGLQAHNAPRLQAVHGLCGWCGFFGVSAWDRV
jgi:hypothetical protein